MRYSDCGKPKFRVAAIQSLATRAAKHERDSQATDCHNSA